MLNGAGLCQKPRPNFFLFTSKVSCQRVAYRRFFTADNQRRACVKACTRHQFKKKGGDNYVIEKDSGFDARRSYEKR